MRWATCQVGESGTVTVQGQGFGRSFGRGAQVDLDDVVSPGAAITWAQALGAHVHLFTIHEEPAPASRPRRERGGTLHAPASPVTETTETTETTE